MSDFSRQTFRAADGLTLVGDIGGRAGAPTVILMHGGGQTRHSWERTMRVMIARGYFVINYDARGHGESDWSASGTYSLDALASDLRAVRETISGPVAFVGASMGGITGFYAVGSSRPPIAQALVMVDIVLKVASAGGEKIQRFMTSHQDGFADLAEAADAVAAYNPDRPRPADFSGLRKNLRLRDDGRFYWHWDPRMLEASPSSEPPARIATLAEISRNVRIPTLVVRGQRSDIVDDEGVAEMRVLVPQTEVYEVAGAGHMVAGDRNDAFSSGVMSFLDRHFPPA